MVADVARGAGLLFLGARLLARPGLRPLLIWPLLTSLAVYGAALGLTLPPALAWLAHAAAALPPWFHEWLGWLVTVLQVLVGVLLVLLIGWLALLLATILASPFYGVLAARVEARLTGRASSVERTLAAEAWATLARELVKLRWSLPRLLVILLLQFVPVAGPLAAPVGFALGAWVMAMQFGDFTPENRGLTFAETRRRLGERGGLTFGFGAVTALGLGIPVVNVLVAPAAVAGGTALWLAANHEWDPRTGLRTP